MGLFDFVKDAGEALTDKVMGGDKTADVTDTVEVSSERVDQLRQEQIAKSIGKLDIDGEQVTVAVNGGVAVLKGRAPTQEALEKMVLCAGNQFGIEQVDCQLDVDAPDPAAAAPEAAPAAEPQATTEAPQGQTESNFYTVQSGDTLGKIAQEHYGSAGKYTVIFEANRPMLADPDKIYPGQKLRIPAL